MPVSRDFWPDHRRMLALAAVTSIEFLENGLVMFGASQIMNGLALSHDDFAFAYTLYAVAVIFMLYKHQWLAERLGYRRFILLSLLFFAVGSICCATAGSFPQFALGRLLQGMGGATFFTAGRMAVNDLPEASRPHALAIFVGSLLGASALAPMLAAGLIWLGGWSAIFWFGLLESLLAAWLAAPHFSSEKGSESERSQAQWGWLLCVALGVFGLQYAIQEIPAVDRGNRHEMLLLAGLSIVLLFVFAWRQWHRERPLINYRGLFQQRYLFGLVFYFAGYVMAGASGFMLPIFLHDALELSLEKSALLTSLGMFASVLTALLHFSLVRRWPQQRTYMLIGIALYALSNCLLAMVGSVDVSTLLIVATVMCGMALPFYLGPVAMGTFSELQLKVFSHGYQVKNMVRQLGLSASIAAATLALNFFAVRNPEHLPMQIAQCSPVFLLMALAMIPLSLLVLSQQTFR